MRTRYLILAAAALSLLTTSANADQIVTYDIGTTTATFPGGGTDTVTGTFTVDFTTNALTAFNISVSGAVILGSSPFTVPNNFNLSGTPTFVSGQATSGSPAGEVLQLVLQNPLGNSPDPITEVNFRNGAVSFTDTFSSSVTGTATPNVNAVPLPATLPLFATGLGALGLLGWRRKKVQTRA
jgi:hypothetical protein